MKIRSINYKRLDSHYRRSRHCPIPVVGSEIYIIEPTLKDQDLNSNAQESSRIGRYLAELKIMAERLLVMLA